MRNGRYCLLNVVLILALILPNLVAATEAQVPKAESLKAPYSLANAADSLSYDETLPEHDIVYTLADTAGENIASTGQTANPPTGFNSDPHGPQRTTFDGGIPDHAYSPFDEEEATACPPDGCDFQEGVLLVKLAPEISVYSSRETSQATNASSLNQLLSAYHVEAIEPIFPNAQPPETRAKIYDGERYRSVPDLTRWVKVRIGGDGDSLKEVKGALVADPSVEIVERDYFRRPVGGPTSTEIAAAMPFLLPGPGTDPRYDDQWHLGATNVPQAWNWLENNGYEPGGNRDVVVAVIDTGVDYTHVDLAANMWVNSAEFGGTPGVDDDGNGYVDDIYGADMVTPDGDPIDDHGHGTHVAGIIAAQAGNSQGGVGVAYNTQVMALKAAQYSGVLAASDIAEAINYAVDKGADVINMSYGGYTRSQVEEDALAVAFGTSVLVAAAGNDELYNEPPCLPYRAMYPAAYNWVLGVMASKQNDIGSWHALFSNKDCVSQNSVEYELLAPGVDILSTLPGDQYAAWDGTSMAAPVVSGIAALLRTRWDEKDVYSSRFIMGQLAANASPVANAEAALTIAPEPELSYLEHWLFDGVEQDPGNDDDGIVDAGEVVDLGIVIRNHWGKADPVTVTLEAWAQGAVMPDPYVTMITDTVHYGAVGSFNIDDNGLIYEDDLVTGVAHPFRFTVPITTPNDHLIPFRLTLEAGNGFDPADPGAPYITQSWFYLIVQRGVELPRIIDADMTLTKDYYYLVPDATLIEQGVTVTVTEGTQIQFWSADPDDPYSQDNEPYLQVEGSLKVQGTYTEPVEFFPGKHYPGYAVHFVRINNAIVELSYVRVLNPRIDASLVDHGYFAQDLFGYVITKDAIDDPMVRADVNRKSRYHSLGGKNYRLAAVTSGQENLYDSSQLFLGDYYLKDSVFLKNYRLEESQWGDRTYWVSEAELGYWIHHPTFLRTAFPSQYDGRTYVLLAKPEYYLPNGLAYLDLAESFAQELGGHVVAIGDAAENAFLVDYLNNIRTAANFVALYPDMDCGSWDCWNLFGGHPTIGLTDKDEEGVFEWVSGEVVSYTNWANNEPASGSPAENEDAVTFDDTPGNWYNEAFVNAIILEFPGTVTDADLESVRQAWIDLNPLYEGKRNAFLNVWWDPDIDHWMRFRAPNNREINAYLPENYWGTTNTDLIDLAIYDYYDDFNYGKLIYQPILTTPPTTTYPFVTDVVVSTAAAADADVVGAEMITVTVSFNRDMDTSIDPAVSFGPDVPQTDYTVHGVDGGWSDARTWHGSFNITPITGDGYQFFRIAGAVAADDPWLVTGEDTERFRFEIITSGTEAMNLQATGGEGKVDLSWTQDDFDLLSGFNLYRAATIDGTYTRLNASIIPPEERAFQDTDVQPGQPYYYKFTVVKSDISESDYSNVASATPVDTIAPVINHTPLTTATPGLSLSIFADVTDNVDVQSVTLYRREIGGASYTSQTMVNTSGDRYSATIPGSEMVSPGIEYYIEASDGVSIVSEGRADLPYQVLVEDQPVVTAVSPDHGPADGGTPVTITGSNFKAGANVTFGAVSAHSVTVVSSSQITCTTPAHFPAEVDVTVTNNDSQSGTMLRAFTFESDIASLGLPLVEGGQNAIVEIPVNIANVHGLAAADLTVTFDQSVLEGQGASTGNLTPGWILEANATTPGQIQISMASSGGTTSGSGVLTNLEFEVLGTPGMTTTLEISSATLNDGAIPTATASGIFTVSLVYDVSGSVLFWSGSAGVPGVGLTLEGDHLYTASSEGDGSFTVSDVPEDDYTLTPKKDDEANGISAYDGSLVLQHAAGLITLSGHQATAADVNKSGSISSMDAFYILQKAVLLINVPFPGAGVVWEFDPAERSYSNLSSDQTGQDFTALLLGDVSGNWSTGGDLPQGIHSPTGETDSMTATLSLAQVSVLPGETVSLPLSLDLPQGNVYGVDLIVAYDPAVVSVLDIQKGALADGWSLVSNNKTPGIIRIAMAGSGAISSGGELLSLDLEAIGDIDSDTVITMTVGELNEGGIPTMLENGLVQIVASQQVDLFLPLIAKQ